MKSSNSRWEYPIGWLRSKYDKPELKDIDDREAYSDNLINLNEIFRYNRK